MATAEIRTRATLDGKGFEVGLNKMQQSVSKWKNGQLKEIGGAIAGAFAFSAAVNFVKGATDAADALDDMTEATGLNVIAIQALIAAGTDWGASQEDIITSMAKLKTLQEEVASGGGKELKNTFDALGISAEEFGSLTTASLLDIIAKAKPTSDVLKDLFGKTGPLKMRGVISDLGTAGGLNELAKAKSWQIDSPEYIARVGALKDKAARAEKVAAKVLVSSMGGALKLTELEGTKADKIAKEKLKAAYELAAVEAKAREDRRKAFDESIKANALLKEQQANEKISVSGPQAADQFARIGAFTGGQMSRFNEQLALGEKQLAEAENHTKYLEEIAIATGE